MIFKNQHKTILNTSGTLNTLIQKLAVKTGIQNKLQ